MRSSGGEHWIALDHLRALAAFMVFAWHFTHAATGYPVPFEGAPRIFPLALLDEGHTGVALFMTLSGYLFAKLLDGKAVSYGPFFWNRFLRLAPILVVAIVLAGVRESLVDPGFSLRAYAWRVASGVVLPTLPAGGWSITVEAHFYLLLPLLLAAARGWRWAPAATLLAAIALRAALLAWHGEVQTLAYWTIIGRIDQFLLGMLAFRHRARLAGRHVAVAAILLAFCGYYYLFDAAGGFYRLGGHPYPSPSPLWIAMPTVEGLAYGVLIAYCDGTFAPRNRGLSRVIAAIGCASYSIYLLHTLFVFDVAAFLHERVIGLGNFYVACLAAAVMFLPAAGLGWLTYRWIELPFLRLRRPYTVRAEARWAPRAMPRAR